MTTREEFMTSFLVGDRVQAKRRILEEGGTGEPDPEAKPCTKGWTHADKGELGSVVHVEPGYLPTVRFDRTNTATIVSEEEVEKLLMPEDTELEFLRYFYEKVPNYLGPADSEIMQSLKESFKKRTKKALPKGYEREE